MTTMTADADPLDRLHHARSAFREAQHAFDLARRELLDAERGVRDAASRADVVMQPR